MDLAIVWLHVLGVIVWIGGLSYQAHVLAPVARRGAVATFADAAARARPASWTAASVVVLTGFYNVTRLGSLELVLESGAGLLLAGKFILVIVLVTVAAQRDFAQLARLRRALGPADATASSEPDPGEAQAALRAIRWLDRIALLLAVAVVYLGLAISRAA